MKLPIETILPRLSETLQRHVNAVLIAPPGAGKTTRVPLSLLDEPWLDGRRILMLEPRRLAARTAARYMAAMLGESVGETVGYRVRRDSRVGPRTRIEVITEGVLTRLIQADQALEQVGLVIFDEFHERSLHADLGLALCLQSQAVLRADLRLLVMSATMDAAPLSVLLQGAPIITSEGRTFPIDTRFLDRRSTERADVTVARMIVQALRQHEGDLLVFVPGMGEIRRVAERLVEAGLDGTIRVAPLHGSLSPEEQDAAIAPTPAGERKVVLATSIAETSLTVAGISVVIDSGLMRVSRFSPRTGMTRLETVTVSRASADQRRGRSGRLAPGVCYRLWTEEDDRHLTAHTTPEILAADLAPLALELAAWGAPDPAALRWLDPPPMAALGQARALLGQLGALGPDGAITPHGRRMAEFGLHPRLAHMVLRALPLGLGPLACEVAALLSERDILSGARLDADLRLRVDALRSSPDAYRRLVTEVRALEREFQVLPGGKDDPDACGLLLAFAYPDRIGQRRSPGRFLLRNGRGAALSEHQPLATADYLVAAELDDQGTEGRILLGAPVTRAALADHFGDQVEEEQIIEWDRAVQAVRGRARARLGALVLRDTQLAVPDPDETLRALLQGIETEGLQILPWTKAARQLQQRLIFMHRSDASWPDASDEALTASLGDWLAPSLYGMKKGDDLQRLHLADIVMAILSWDQRRQLDEWAPTHIAVPSGSQIPIDYTDPAAPVVSVRLQEVFGVQQTPRIAGGKVPLTLHLLSPARRPVQVTQDLASFWRNAYFEVRKDLRGRYPKHYWPEDPLTATPTNRTRPRS